MSVSDGSSIMHVGLRLGMHVGHQPSMSVSDQACRSLMGLRWSMSMSPIRHVSLRWISKDTKTFAYIQVNAYFKLCFKKNSDKNGIFLKQKKCMYRVTHKVCDFNDDCFVLIIVLVKYVHCNILLTVLTFVNFLIKLDSGQTWDND